MGDVVDRSEEFRLMDMRRKYARLAGLVETWKADIEADPWPYIDTMNERMHRMEQCIREVERVLNPAPRLVTDDEPIRPPPDIRDEALQRLGQADALVRTWREEDLEAMKRPKEPGQ